MSSGFPQSLCFRRLKQLVTIDQVLKAYNLCDCLKHNGVMLYGPCPLHGGDNKTAFRAHIKRGIWRCFTVCGGGDIIDLVRTIERCSYAQAAQHLRAVAHQHTASLPYRSNAHAPQTFRPFRRKITLNPNVPFLQLHKRISVQTAVRFEAGCAEYSCFLRGTVAIRLHDLQGRPLGYCGRRLNQDIDRYGKWRFPRGLQKSALLFNAHRAAHDRASAIVVVECPWAVMRLAQAGIAGAVALLGTSMSDIQAAWLKHASRVVLLLDGDKAGIRATSLIAQKLPKLTTVSIALPHNHEPEDLTDHELAHIVRASLPSL